MKSKPAIATPWGRAIGLLMASLVTLVCVGQGMDPIEILKRALLAFVIVGGTTGLVIRALHMMARTASKISN